MEKRTRVLLADANEEFRILLRQLLEETGEFGTISGGVSFEF